MFRSYYRREKFCKSGGIHSITKSLPALLAQDGWWRAKLEDSWLWGGWNL